MRHSTTSSGRRARRSTATLAGAVLALAGTAAWGTGSASASPATTTLFTESFAQAQTAQPSWALPTNGGNSACLTASGDYGGTPIRGCWETSRDAAGAGALHLTSSVYGAVGTAYYDAGLPSAQGVDVTFNTYQFGVNGGHAGDGISFILAATDPGNPSAPTTVGPAGGALGYTGVPGNAAGVPHGYLGFGLDTVGGFGSSSVGDPSCPATTSAEQTVAVRGPGDGTAGYCVLGVQPSAGPIDSPYAWSRPTPVPVEVVLNTTGSSRVSRTGITVPAGQWLIAWTSYGAPTQTLTGALPTEAALQTADIPAGWYDPVTHVPYQLSFGWAGSTGAWQENHEVNDVVATTLGGLLPVYDLAVDDSGSGQLATGATGAVTVVPALDVNGGDEARAATVTTTLPAGLVPSNPVSGGYDCTTTGQVVSCTTTGATPFAAGTALPTLSIPVVGSTDRLGTQSVTAKVSSIDGNPATAQHDVAVKAAQTVEISSTPGATVPGATYDVVATGGASGNPVTFALDDPSTTACSVDGDVVTFEHVGSCVLDAEQAGSDSYLPGVAQQTIAVQAIATSTVTTLSRSTSVFGQPVTATVDVTPASAGAVQFSVDGQDVGAAVALGGDGSATSPVLTDGAGHALTTGAHQVAAAFTPDDATVVGPSSAVAQTLTVEQASTTTAVTVHASSLEAAVSVTAPGAGTPSGDVRFTVDGRAVGTAPVVDGVATLTYAVPASQSHSVAATYLGDTAFAGSSASTARNNPTITAHVSSAHAKQHGWYRSPVTVTFSCATHGAALTAACPGPTTLSGQGAARSVSRTIAAVDGGVATVTVRGINIDRTAPWLRIRGVHAGARYFDTALPIARCAASDRLSGLSSCTLRRSRHGSSETIVATAVDRAGNVRHARVTVHVVKFAVVAPSRGSTYLVWRNHTYTVLAVSTTRPQFVDAALAPRRPRGDDNSFHRIGHDRWALGVTMAPNMARHTTWNLGVRTGRTVHVLTVRVR